MDTLTPKQRSRLMAKIPSRHSAPERAVRSMLHRLGYRFRMHRPDLPGTPDIVLPSRKKAIFVHGCFWHGHNCGACRMPSTNRKYWQGKIEANQTRDRKTRRRLFALGWRNSAVWTCELRNPDKLTRKLVKFLES